MVTDEKRRRPKPNEEVPDGMARPNGLVVENFAVSIQTCGPCKEKVEDARARGEAERERRREEKRQRDADRRARRAA